MVTVQIEHPIRDFASWRAAFDRDPAGRQGAGVRCYRVYRPVGDPKYVLVARTVADYKAGAFSPVIDSVFDGDRVAQFLDRTYNDGDRFGKAVFRYLD